MSNIFAIHGAFSTPRMFAYLKTQLSEHKWNFLDYRDQISDIDTIINTAKTQSFSEKTHVIGHSMGGLIALALANEPWVQSVTTIATPLAGLDFNLVATYLSRSHFLSEISQNSKLIKHIHSQKYHVPALHIITTQGYNPYMFEANDGVVTLRSQKKWSCGTTLEIDANHSEVLLHEKTVNALSNWLK